MAKCCNLVINYDPIFGMSFSTIETKKGQVIASPKKVKVKSITNNVPTNPYFLRKPSIRK